jgi:NAD-dependent dihydropyrimidine dehydrogenase PreA subunit
MYVCKCTFGSSAIRPVKLLYDMLGNVGRGLESWRSGGTGTKCRGTTHNCNDKRPLHEAGACCSGCTSCNRNCPLKPCIVRFVSFPISYLYVARIPSFAEIGTTFYPISSLTPALLHISD